MEALKTALEAIDEYNLQDPHRFSWNGMEFPQEYFFSLRVYEWVQKLVSSPSTELRLAARAHHIGRWEIPRERFPEGRTGYLNWRRELGRMHALKTAAILEKQGYDAPFRERVSELIQKKRLKTDAEVQALENALCLVFLEYQYEDFRTKHPREKVLNILRKTLIKMDAQGRGEALKLAYSAEGKACIEEALDQLEQGPQPALE